MRPGRAGWPHDALAQALGIRGAARAEELEALLLERAPDLVLVDDADEVDADSLELLGNLGSQGRFGLVLRVAQTEDTEHGDRSYRAVDPEGHRFIFAMPIASASKSTGSDRAS